MPAHLANKYAEKWTRERTIRTLEYIRSFADKEDCYYLGQAIADAGYYDDLWAYWRRKWRDDYDIISMMKRMLQVFEARLFKKTAKGEIPVRVGMFALSHHYGWGREPKPKPQPVNEFREPEYEPEEAFDEEMEMEEDMMPGEPSLEEQLADEVRRIKDDFDPAEFNRPRLHSGLRDFYAHKVTQYNIAHPDTPITELMSYHDGPPDSPEGIDFEGGHFMPLRIDRFLVVK